MGAEALRRFERETAAVGRLDHPHLVAAHDAGEADGLVYLVLEYLEGTDLHRRVDAEGPLPVPEACEMVRQAALGLQHLHEQGLVHRDIKPSNLLCSPEGRLKVLDLGLVRGGPEDTSLTSEGQFLGTLDYLAPEQAEDGQVDIRADLYGLGGTLFFLLTGRAPFAHHKGRRAKLNAHADQTPPGIRTLRPDIPSEVAGLVGRLLAKRPEDRFATPQEVVEEIARLGTVAEARPARPFPRPPRPRWRNPRAAALAAVGGLALLLFVPLWLTRDRFRRPSPAPQPNPEVPAPPPEVPAPARPPLAVREAGVDHFENRGEVDRPRGLLGRGSFATTLDDAVTLSARLSEPAYCYWIAFRPDGVEELCFPESEDVPPERTDRPRYPSVSAGVYYGLTDGTGLQAFFLVVSREPLPAYKEWRERLGESPWARTPAEVGVVWRYDGVEVRAVTAEDLAGVRGAGVQRRGAGGMMDRLAAWLRQGPGVEALEGVGFAVGPRP